MKELKSKKTGRVFVYSDEDYDEMVDKGVINMKNFIVTDLKVKSLIPAFKEPPKVIKKTKKNEG